MVHCSLGQTQIRPNYDWSNGRSRRLLLRNLFGTAHSICYRGDGESTFGWAGSTSGTMHTRSAFFPFVSRQGSVDSARSDSSDSCMVAWMEGGVTREELRYDSHWRVSRSLLWPHAVTPDFRASPGIPSAGASALDGARMTTDTVVASDLCTVFSTQAEQQSFCVSLEMARRGGRARRRIQRGGKAIRKKMRI